MPEYITEVYSIRDDADKILYVGRRTPNENRSQSRSANILNEFKRNLRDESIRIVSEGLFGSVKEAILCITNTTTTKYERTPVEAPVSTVRKRAVKTSGQGRTNRFVDFTWNEKAQTYFIIDAPDSAP